MMQKITSDFVILKEFTENASHEMQTPLAIIKSKLEHVMQDKTLTDRQHHQIKSAFESAIRLSKLNEGMLLLSRIENQQFVGKEEIDFCRLIQSKVEYLQELFDLKKVEVKLHLEDVVTISIHPMLADVLVNNLLSNAMKHNFENGRIIITAHQGALTFSNTGRCEAIDVDMLFKRFAKQSVSGESNGLGLSIADEICKTNHLQLNYYYQNEMHHFSLLFKS